MTRLETVGIVGLGRMGGGMCRTLLRAGIDVVAWDLAEPAREQARTDGARIAADPAALADLTRTVVLSLPDAHAVNDVLFGERGLIHDGSRVELVLDTSTTLPREARELAAAAAARGVEFLDAPLSGGVRGAETGTLAVMVGGSAEAFERARPVASIIGRTVVHCGPAGAGQVAKACNQLIVMATLEAVAETLVLADEAGLDPRRIREVLMSGLAASPILENQGLRMIERDFVPGGRCIFHLKDIATIRELATEAGLDLPVFDASAARMEQLVDACGGELDHSAIVTTVERRPLGRRDDAAPAAPAAPADQRH